MRAQCVILASKGYPQKNETGFIINGLNNITAQNVLAFHAGTAWQAQDIVNASGCVLGITAWDNNLEKAVKIAYTAITNIQFKGMQYWHEIGKLS
jgi:phosphoribosylamine--glycine ligase